MIAGLSRMIFANKINSPLSLNDGSINIFSGNLLWFISGMIVGSKSVEYLEVRDIGAIFIVYFTMFAIRTAMLLICYPYVKVQLCPWLLLWSDFLFNANACGISVTCLVKNAIELSSLLCRRKHSPLIFFDYILNYDGLLFCLYILLGDLYVVWLWTPLLKRFIWFSWIRCLWYLHRRCPHSTQWRMSGFHPSEVCEGPSPSRWCWYCKNMVQSSTMTTTPLLMGRPWASRTSLATMCIRWSARVAGIGFSCLRGIRYCCDCKYWFMLAIEREGW